MVRLGDSSVTVIQGQVGFTAVSDKNRKENFQAVDGEEVLRKIRGFQIPSWNYIGHDPTQFRHYGPMSQDFFAAFGQDSIGTIGTETTITTTDLTGILMIAVQALEKRTTDLTWENELLQGALAERTSELEYERASIRTRMELLEQMIGINTAGLATGKTVSRVE